MFPADFIKRIRAQSYIDAESLLAALKEPSPVSVSINTRKWNRKPAVAEPVPWCETGYYLESRPSFTLDPLFHAGCYYPREASGMFLEQVFRQLVPVAENLRVLDLCGAPGGKSTQISGMIGTGSVLVSNEVIRHRAAILAETLTKWGNPGVMVTQNDPAVFGRLKGYFDIIVIDAPCSGEGMFRDPVAVGEWTMANAFHCAERQKRIIMDVWPALKENGLLVYSTCTFNPAENEENVSWLVENTGSKSLGMDISGFDDITEIQSNGITGYGFYPGKVKGEGFFVSAIRKTGPAEALPMRFQRRKEYLPGRQDTAIAQQWTTFPENQLLKRGEELTGLACDPGEFLYLFSNLNVVKAGTMISVNKKNDYLPSHEIALSGMLRKEAFPEWDLSYADAVGYLRRDQLPRADLSPGWILVTYKGVNLGFIKNIGKRINNYFPVEWRIRMNMAVPGSENTIRWA
jgi:16S rRNA C967 or C1407 C5-methylase (RsmB/RsmF family)/NOL1/NOP2/fmu family ribosome biogenesis protein